MDESDSCRGHDHSAPQYGWQVIRNGYRSWAFEGRALFVKQGNLLPANVLEGGKRLLDHSVDQFSDVQFIPAMDEPLYVLVVPAQWKLKPPVPAARPSETCAGPDNPAARRPSVAVSRVHP